MKELTSKRKKEFGLDRKRVRSALMIGWRRRCDRVPGEESRGGVICPPWKRWKPLRCNPQHLRLLRCSFFAFSVRLCVLHKTKMRVSKKREKMSLTSLRAWLVRIFLLFWACHNIVAGPSPKVFSFLSQPLLSPTHFFECPTILPIYICLLFR
jgi:hypothetical protein